MTVMTETIPVDQLREQARQVRPGHGVVTVIAAVFVALGWTIGAIVTGLAFAGVCSRYGYWRGRGLTDEQITARAAAKAAASARQETPAGPARPSKL